MKFIIEVKRNKNLNIQLDLKLFLYKIRTAKLTSRFAGNIAWARTTQKIRHQTNSKYTIFMMILNVLHRI